MSCRACGATIAGKASWAWYCEPCSRVVKAIRRPAASRLANAIQYHAFPPPTRFKCVDCGQYQASFYDHRSYWRPLDVEPVCGACNRLRGPADELVNGVEHFEVAA